MTIFHMSGKLYFLACIFVMTCLAIRLVFVRKEDIISTMNVSWMRFCIFNVRTSINSFFDWVHGPEDNFAMYRLGQLWQLRNMVLLARDGAPSGLVWQCAQSDDGNRLCSTATGASAPWRPTLWPSRGSQRRGRSLHLRHSWFCSSATARLWTFRCQCAQADDRSRPCSMATGALAPWRPTAGFFPRSQRRALSLHVRHFEFMATARGRVGWNMGLLACDGAPSGLVCQCVQSDDGNRLCSTATGASAPWRPKAGPFVKIR